MNRSIPHLPLLLLASLMMIFIGSCRNSSDRLYPFGWTRTDPAFDSLTVKAEYAFLEFEPDSVLEPVIAGMKKLADLDPHHPEKMARFHYWNARFKLRHALIDDAMEEFLVSRALTDSTRHPYDVARIRWNMELEEPEGADGYFHALKKIELFKKFNDLPMQAAYYMSLGATMNEVGNSVSALRYLNSADSLLRLSGLKGQAAGNMINRARSLEKANREKEAAALLKEALNDSTFRKNPMAVNIAQWNLYLYTDSLNYLLDAYRGLAGDLEEETMRPLYGSHLLKEYARRGWTDSVARLLPVIKGDSAALEHLNQKRDFFIGLAAGEQALGNKDEALRYYGRAIDYVNEIMEDETADEVTRIEQRRIIDEQVYKEELKRKDRTLWLLAALIIVSIAGAAAIIIYRRRISRHREEQLRSLFAEEQTRRKVLALEIAMEENRRMGENIRETVDSLEKDGLVSPSASGTLEAAIKSHEITRPAQESFVSTFSDVNPRFLEALDKKYPHLTKTDRRLAVYISLGLDSKHISRLTGVRPESVKQGRWRLRSKLGLPEGVSLEDEMKNLMKEE